MNRSPTSRIKLKFLLRTGSYLPVYRLFQPHACSYKRDLFSTFPQIIGWFTYACLCSAFAQESTSSQLLGATNHEVSGQARWSPLTWTFGMYPQPCIYYLHGNLLEMCTLGSHPWCTQYKSTKWQSSRYLYLQIPVREPALEKLARALQLDTAVPFAEHSAHSVYVSVSATKVWAHRGHGLLLIISVLSVPLMAPGPWSGSTNVCLFKLNWPAGQPGTKKAGSLMQCSFAQIGCTFIFGCSRFWLSWCCFCLIFLNSQMV